MIKRLLIITQKVDRNDPVLGFFHRWIEEFAKHLDRVEVICLWEGEHGFKSESRITNKELRDANGISNVRIHSLGKEKGFSKIRQLFRFWQLCGQLTPQTDAVFVHMNALYIPLGWPWWHTKRILLWRNHPQGGWLARIACRLANIIFYTSPQAFVARYGGKAMQMPAGIATDLFMQDPAVTRLPNSILYLGRISPIKRLEIIIEAAAILQASGIPFTLSIVGSPVNPEDRAYEKRMQELAAGLVQTGIVRFIPAVGNADAPQLYQSHELFVNATPTGSFDKTVLEAMACGCTPLVSNRGFFTELSQAQVFQEGDARDLAEKLQLLLSRSATSRNSLGEKMRVITETHHSIQMLVTRVLSIL